MVAQWYTITVLARLSPSTAGEPLCHSILTSARRRDGGRQLGDRCSDDPIEEGCDNEFVDDARRTPVVDGNILTVSGSATLRGSQSSPEARYQCSSQCDPDIAGCDPKTAQAQQAEVALQLLLMAGNVEADFIDWAIIVGGKDGGPLMGCGWLGRLFLHCRHDDVM